MGRFYFIILTVTLVISSCGKRECDCDELYLDKDSVYRISNNGDKTIREAIARRNNLNHLITGLEIEDKKTIDEKRKQNGVHGEVEYEEMSEEEIRKRTEEEFSFEYGRLESRKKNIAPGNRKKRN